MSRFESEWDEGLRRGPFRSRMFTPELAAGVRRRVASGEQVERPSERRPSWLRVSLVAAVVGAVCAAVVLTAVDSGLPGTPGMEMDGPRQQSAVVEGERQRATSDVVAPVLPGDRPALPVRIPQDSQWQELVEQSYPYVQTSMLHKKSIREDVMLVFSRKLLEAEGYLSASLVIDEFVWGRTGWKSQARVGYHPGDNLLESADQGLLTAWSGISLDSQDSGQFVTMFYGVIVDPAITDIRVTDDGGRVHPASVHDAGDGFAYWLAALPPGEKGSYTVEGAAADGTLVYEEYYYYR